MINAELFHPEYLETTPYFGVRTKQSLAYRAETVAGETAALPDPDVSVVIRSKNNIEWVEGWFEEIHNQAFEGEVEVVLVDTESRDGTWQKAHELGATVANISQNEFNYPKAHNLGFEVASHPYILTLVGHSNLSSNMTLRGLTRWQAEENLGGVYGTALPGKQSSWSERIGAVVLGVPGMQKAAERITKSGMGVMAANCSIVSRDAWRELGGYNEAYAGGGEDGDLGKRMIEAGMTVIREPVVSVHHTHNLGPINSLRQLRSWQKSSQPSPFDADSLLRRRPDLHED
jgi:glycosyltransferase involved in cell wall biosynthesis